MYGSPVAGMPGRKGAAPLDVRGAHGCVLARHDVVERQQPVLASIARLGRQLQTPLVAANSLLHINRPARCNQALTVLVPC